MTAEDNQSVSREASDNTSEKVLVQSWWQFRIRYALPRPLVVCNGSLRSKHVYCDAKHLEEAVRSVLDSRFSSLE